MTRDRDMNIMKMKQSVLSDTRYETAPRQQQYASSKYYEDGDDDVRRTRTRIGGNRNDDRNVGDVNSNRRRIRDDAYGNDRETSFIPRDKFVLKR